MKNFKAVQTFGMVNEQEKVSYVFGKGIADGKEKYAFILDGDVAQSTTHEEMKQIFNDLRRRGWKMTPTINLEAKAPEAPAEGAKAKAKVETKAKAKAEAEVDTAHKWLFPRKVKGGEIKWSSKYFNKKKYLEKGKELGFLTKFGTVRADKREEVYLAIGGKVNENYSK